MTKYEGDLWSLAIKSTEQADHEKALRCCIGVCDCLQQMHEKGFVHGDLKLLNVLFKGNTGFVSDFGFCSEVEKPILHTGTVLYQAPEKVFNLSRKLDKSMDMFSFGIMLLGIVDRNRYLQWRKDIEELKRITTSRGSVPENREAMYKKYCDLHSKLMADLAKSSDPICTDLIFPLLNFDPTKRPTIGEAKATFTRLLRERQEAHPLPPAQP